ncbi:hypothetical protein JJD41_16830 [Oxynema sp. CENA135]|uniref:hypothetical protein n=1 Tax=Oxynema sp. CENA135 TaxID=984206 RepID=UPI0019098FA8|nr:hypothetical protein [Oxynema sp. CENA135]MBK4731517.1 hypothetical protein [Oxynema sp. CENA135]
MLVILMDDRVLPSRQVCQTCLLADRTGQPRWRPGQLCCGHAIRKSGDRQAECYQCEMGFTVAHIE